MVTITCKVGGIVVSGVTGGSEDPDVHALSTIGTNTRKSTMEYPNRVDRIISLLTSKTLLLMRRDRLQDESDVKTQSTYNNRRSDNAQHLRIEASYLDITHISQLEKVHIF